MIRQLARGVYNSAVRLLGGAPGITERRDCVGRRPIPPNPGVIRPSSCPQSALRHDDAQPGYSSSRRCGSGGRPDRRGCGWRRATHYRGGGGPGQRGQHGLIVEPAPDGIQRLQGREVAHLPAGQRDVQLIVNRFSPLSSGNCAPGRNSAPRAPLSRNSTTAPDITGPASG